MTQNKLSRSAISILQEEAVKQKFKEILGANSAAFITSVLAVVQSSDKLKKATPESVYMAAMMAAALKLPVNPNLGFAYIIPYNTKIVKDGQETWIDVAQFQMGYKGFIQLAQRSGQYKTISAAVIYEGQLVAKDPLKGFEFNWEAKTSDKMIGAAAYFSLTNGFEKVFYMDIEQLQSHGLRYSKTFKQGSSKWKTDFEAMALKTVLKLLISKYGPMSVDSPLHKAIIADQAIIKNAETMDVEYADATEQPEAAAPAEIEPPSQSQMESERFLQLLQNAKDEKALNKLRKDLSKYPEHQQAFLDRETNLTTPKPTDEEGAK